MPREAGGENGTLSAALGVLDAPKLVREQAFESLKKAIIAGQLPPGRRLVERELCEALGVSRTSIRETLRRLEAERLIKVEPRKGPTVARITRREAEQIYDIRAYLEGLMIVRFVEAATEDDLRSLRAILGAFEGFAAAAELEKCVEVMVEFYDHIKQVAGLEVVNDIHSQLTARVSYLRATSMRRPDRIRYSLQELDRLVTAIEARDAAAAKRAAVTHVKMASQAALSALED